MEQQVLTHENVMLIIALLGLLNVTFISLLIVIASCMMCVVKAIDNQTEIYENYLNENKFKRNHEL